MSKKTKYTNQWVVLFTDRKGNWSSAKVVYAVDAEDALNHTKRTKSGSVQPDAVIRLQHPDTYPEL